MKMAAIEIVTNTLITLAAVRIFLSVLNGTLIELSLLRGRLTIILKLRGRRRKIKAKANDPVSVIALAHALREAAEGK